MVVIILFWLFCLFWYWFHSPICHLGHVGTLADNHQPISAYLGCQSYGQSGGKTEVQIRQWTLRRHLWLAHLPQEMISLMEPPFTILFYLFLLTQGLWTVFPLPFPFIAIDDNGNACLYLADFIHFPPSYVDLDRMHPPKYRWNCNFRGFNFAPFMFWLLLIKSHCFCFKMLFVVFWNAFAITCKSLSFSIIRSTVKSPRKNTLQRWRIE